MILSIAEEPRNPCIPLRYCLCSSPRSPPRPQVSPPKWQRKKHRQLCASLARGVKRGNFWNDGCRRWCPICFSSLQFTASAMLCKQLGSTTRPSAISQPPFSFFHVRPAMSLREHHFRFLWSDSLAFTFCLDASIGVFTFASITTDRGATVVLTVYRRASCTSKWRLKNVVMSYDLATTKTG